MISQYQPLVEIPWKKHGIIGRHVRYGVPTVDEGHIKPLYLVAKLYPVVKMHMSEWKNGRMVHHQTNSGACSAPYDAWYMHCHCDAHIHTGGVGNVETSSVVTVLVG